MSKSEIKTEEKILEFLALNKEMSQYDLTHEIGVDYTSILRQLKKLEDEDKVKVLRTERSNEEGKTKKIYSLTFLGVVQLFLNWNNKDVETIDVVSVAKNYPNIGLLSFKKFPVFKKAGLEYLFGEYIKKGFLRAFRKGITLQKFLKPRRTEENLETMIDRNILTDSVIIEKNTFFIEVCKNDPELKQFIEAEFERKMEDFYSYKNARELWESTKRL